MNWMAAHGACAVAQGQFEERTGDDDIAPLVCWGEDRYDMNEWEVELERRDR